MFEYLLKNLPHHPEDSINGYWSNGETLLCDTKEKAENIADFIESVLPVKAVTGFYDPQEDGELEDECTGYYYVNID